MPDDLEAGEKRPAIVMAHGFSSVKENYLANFAEKFEEAGFVVLVFDYRYFGDSEGEPQGHLIPAEQHKDYKNAITWLSQHSEVDPDRVGIWGSSYSGGHVLYLASFDKQVKAALAQVPLVNSWENAQRLMRPDVFEEFLEALAHDRIQRYAGEESAKVPVVAPEGEPSALPTPESYEWFTHAGEIVAPNRRNEVSLESMEAFLDYDPARNIHLISPIPLLMVVSEKDTLTPFNSDGTGRPIILLLTEGQMSDHKGASLIFHALPDAEALIADKGYDSDAFRRALADRGISPCIPPRERRRSPAPHCKTLYKQRHKVENMFAKLKDWRRLALRYDRCAHTFFSAICIASTVIFWLGNLVLTLVILESGKHFDAYTEPGLSEAVTPAVEWFERHLMENSVATAQPAH